MRGSKRPTTERAKVAGLAVVLGVPEAARQTGVSERSIRRYLEDPELSELAIRKKELVDQEWWAFVQKGFRRVADLLESTEDVQKAATATAIIYDKLALSTGQATQRTETRSLDDDLDDHEAEVLGEVVRAELARRANQETERSAVEGAPPA